MLRLLRKILLSEHAPPSKAEPCGPGPFAEVFEHGGYLTLLGLAADALPIIQRIGAVVRRDPDCSRYVASMLGDPDWRFHLVACIASLVSADRRPATPDLWGALDRGSWVAPQIAVTLLRCDPNFVSEAKRRITAGCPVEVPSIAPSLLRHVLTGPANPAERSSKNLSALLSLVGRLPSEQQWAREAALSPDAQEVLRLDADDADKIALDWDARLTGLLGRQDGALPDSAV